MPRNANGIYTLPPLNPVVPFTVIATQWANTTLPDIATALTNSIAADGVTQVTANLPMNSFRHTGVGQALSATQYARADQSQAFVFNIITNIANADTVSYTGVLPFGIGSTAAIPPLMPVLFVPSVNNGGPSTLALNGGAPSPILNSDLTPLVAGQIHAGRPYALVYGSGNWILITNTLDLATLNTVYLRLNGGTMTGPLFLSQNPDQPTGAATKAYVDAAISGSVAGVASFNTRTGAVTLLSGDVTTALSYTPANIAGSTFTGNVNAPNIAVTTKITAPVIIPNFTNTPANTGAVTLNCAAAQNWLLAMSGNVVFTFSNPTPGQMVRVHATTTAGKTITWPGTTLWPGPSYAAPVIDAGPQKAILASLEWNGGAWIANASVY